MEISEPDYKAWETLFNTPGYAVLTQSEFTREFFIERVKHTPQIVRTMDSLLCDMADFPERREHLGRQLQKLIPRAGHLTGFYMTNVILAQLGKEALVREVGNPFAFIRQYNKAAEVAGGVPVFSKKAMDQIAWLEARYTDQR